MSCFALLIIFFDYLAAFLDLNFRQIQNVFNQHSVVLHLLLLLILLLLLLLLLLAFFFLLIICYLSLRRKLGALNETLLFLCFQRIEEKNKTSHPAGRRNFHNYFMLRN